MSELAIYTILVFAHTYVYLDPINLIMHILVDSYNTFKITFLLTAKLFDSQVIFLALIKRPLAIWYIFFLKC